MLYAIIRQHLENKNREAISLALEAYAKHFDFSNFCFLITGSTHFMSTVDRCFNGKSDIDTLLIFDKCDADKLKLIFPQKAVQAYKDRRINILCDKISYGEGKNSISVRFIDIDMLNDIISLSPIQMLKYRKWVDVSKKKPLKFYYNDIQMGFYLDDNVYENIDGLFVKSVNYQPIQSGKLCLSDTHYMLLLSEMSCCSENFTIEWGTYFKNIASYTKNSATQEDCLNFFNYTLENTFKGEVSPSLKKDLLLNFYK